MEISIQIMLASGGVLLALFCLFYLESKRRKRFLASFRNYLDRWVLKSGRLLWHITHHLGTGSIRMTIHYVIHRVLGVLVWFLNLLQTYFAKLQMRNRKVVRSVQADKKNTHLEAVRAHKEAVALTEEEKKELKEKSLEG